MHVVEDDPGMRRTLERLLTGADFQVLSYNSPEIFLESAKVLATGCIVLDFHMPGMIGLEVQSRLDQLLGIRIPVLMMTGVGGIRMAVRAIKAGAVDFLEKPFDDYQLISAIEDAIARGTFDSRSAESAKAARLVAALSPREAQVLKSLIEGQANKTIAWNLGISVRTVEIHRARMLKRLGARNVAEAIRLGVLATFVSEVG